MKEYYGSNITRYDAASEDQKLTDEEVDNLRATLTDDRADLFNHHNSHVYIFNEYLIEGGVIQFCPIQGKVHGNLISSPTIMLVHATEEGLGRLETLLGELKAKS